jgi:hypothetical protein
MAGRGFRQLPQSLQAGACQINLPVCSSLSLTFILMIVPEFLMVVMLFTLLLVQICKKVSLI